MQPLQPINILAKIFTNAGIGITIDNIFYAFISNNNDKQQMKKNDFNIILQVENENFANVKKEFIDAKLTLIKRPYNISDISEIESTDTQTIDRYDFLVDLLVEKSIEYTNEIIDEFVSDKIKII
jgi:hypothetical protein